MGIRADTDRLLAWFHEREEATVSDVVAAGLMKSRMALEAVRYACRYRTLEPVVRPDANGAEQVFYRTTGVALPVPRSTVLRAGSRARSGLCFDGLLKAWGMTVKPRQLKSVESHRHQISDDDEAENPSKLRQWTGRTPRRKTRHNARA